MAVGLVGNDEKQMQEIVVDYIQGDGHTCKTAIDGIEEITIWKTEQVGLAVLDIMMQHMDGLAVCRLAREMSNLPIIFLTAKGEEADKLKGYELAPTII